MNNNLVPADYVPYERAWICSNSFDEGRFVLEVEGVPVFLIGKSDDGPLVWLNLPATDSAPGRLKWQQVISRSVSQRTDLEVISTEYGYCVVSNEKLVLEFRIESGVLVVSVIDLRVLGLNVFGNLKLLEVSGIKLERGTFLRVVTMVAIGGPPPQSSASHR